MSGLEKTIGRLFALAGGILLLAGIPGCAGVTAGSGGSELPAGHCVSVQEAGAVGDGRTLNTPRIQAAIDRLAAQGGGTLVVPRGEFLSGAIFLKPGVNLHLEKGAVLKGSTNVADYPKQPTRIEGQFVEWIPALVNADQCDQLRITGAGTLDGNGQAFYTRFWNARQNNPKVTNLAVERPRLAFIQNSTDVQVRGIKFKDSGFWNLHFYRCADVLVENTRFEAPYGKPPRRGPSTDGVDIDSCQRVTVRGCSFEVNDDCVCLKGTKGPLALNDTNSPPTTDILVTNCTFRAGHGVVTLGSEATVIRNVTVADCRVTGRIPLVRLKLRPDTAQIYEHIYFRNIALAAGGAAYRADIFEIAPWAQFFDLKGQPAPKSVVRNVTLTGIKGAFGSLGVIQGNPGQTEISDITIRDMDVRLESAQFTVGKVTGLALENVKVNGEPFTWEPAE
jgi:alpha-L-rhamnosidase